MVWGVFQNSKALFRFGWGFRVLIYLGSPLVFRMWLSFQKYLLYPSSTQSRIKDFKKKKKYFESSIASHKMNDQDRDEWDSCRWHLRQYQSQNTTIHWFPKIQSSTYNPNTHTASTANFKSQLEQLHRDRNQFTGEMKWDAEWNMQLIWL